MKGLPFASCSAASILWSAGAQAQTVEAPNSDPQDGLDEIVVTANRTESAAQKTPVSLSVYTGEEHELLPARRPEGRYRYRYQRN